MLWAKGVTPRPLLWTGAERDCRCACLCGAGGEGASRLWCRMSQARGSTTGFVQLSEHGLGAAVCVLWASPSCRLTCGGVFWQHQEKLLFHWPSYQYCALAVLTTVKDAAWCTRACMHTLAHPCTHVHVHARMQQRCHKTTPDCGGWSGVFCSGPKALN